MLQIDLKLYGRINLIGPNIERKYPVSSIIPMKQSSTMLTLWWISLLKILFLPSIHYSIEHKLMSHPQAKYHKYLTIMTLFSSCKSADNENE